MTPKSLAEITVPGRTMVMGILNITVDSFSDGGKYIDLEAALTHAHELVAAGADIIDVGAESTRPGATRVPAEIEAQRIAPVIRELNKAGILTSVDTMRAHTAEIAAQAGVNMINDVSGGLADPQMLSLMAETGLPVCLMHWKTEKFGDAAGQASYTQGVVAEVEQAFEQLVSAALKAGIAAENIVLDPGLGFAKTASDNWQLMQALPYLIASGYPILVGASRKRFLTALRTARGLETDPVSADAATTAISTMSAMAGAWGVRVHNAVESRDAIDAVAAVINANPTADIQLTTDANGVLKALKTERLWKTEGLRK
ncbi:dihydropteroate synthase [Corynebacterium caspium]|uniref:dihydropteroate synthase n=1 Tax=Corynebacterium caspium TaxID=234828 RepID=UPI000361324B|nr:dihydropteroate synthase [Corynebacterium caspium]WKD58693.1 Dihydropteroate synthase 1 [Corynebacterium caspium DSM 44850]